MYRLIIFVMTIGFLYGIEIDTSIENNLSKNDIKDRLLLANYYFDKNLTKAQKFVDEVLKIKPSKQAKLLKKQIELKKEYLKFFQNKNINKFYQTLFYQQQYKKIKQLSKYLKFIKNDYPKIITAKIYFWDGNYKKTKQILKLVKNKNLDYLEIDAYLSYYEGNYLKAKREFWILYNATYKLDYAYKIIDIYIFLNDLNSANKLIDKLLKKYPKDKKLFILKEKISKQKEKDINKLLKIYKQTGKFVDLQKVVTILLTYDENRAYKLLEDYIKQNPNDQNAKYWYATYLSWSGNNKRALKILEQIVANGDFRVKLLIGKIYSWNGDYDKAINYLNDIIANSGNQDLVIQAKEAKGLIYYWQRNYQKAKPLLKEVLKYKPSVDAKEALMVMNSNVKPLIKKYKLLSRQNPSNLDYLLRVGQYSEMINDINTAIIYYERYYKIRQKLSIAHSLARLYLLKKNYYKGFSYYEYWAYQKGDVKSLYELAENYYYVGYNKSALSVIRDILMIDKNFKKALQLKAKILQYSPKFAQENSTQSLKTIFKEKSSKLLEFGNRLYFNGFYKEANVYYKKYILDNPEDYEIRERFSYSLEFSGKYKEASGEFFLLTWQKKSCRILYHYGFCLEKSNKIKMAKKIYEEGLKIANTPAPQFIVDFIKRWKTAWESQNIDKYKEFYSKVYKNNKVWLVRKENIFRKVNFISIYIPNDISVISTKQIDDKKIYKIRFYQQYGTNKRIDKGYKILSLECQNKKCLIIKESWQKGKYIPENYQCFNQIKLKLENLNKPKQVKKIVKKVEVHKVKKITLKKKKIIILENNNTKKILKEVKKKKVVKKLKKTKKEDKKLLFRIGLLGYYSNDKDNMKLIDYGIFLKRENYYLDIKKWKLYQNENSRDGKYIDLHYLNNGFELGFELGNYENGTYIYPYLSYKNIKYFQSITGKDKKSFCAVDKRLITDHLVYSKYNGFNSKHYKELTKNWYSLELSKIDSNIIFTPQFQNEFYDKSYKNIENYFYFSGWYQYNSTPTSCYYSPNFTDATFIELHPLYKKFELIGKIGYSFEGQSFLYGYGFDYRDKIIHLGCKKNHSYKNGDSNYWYDECYLKMGVDW